MANITATTAAAFIPEVWSKDVLAAVGKNLVMANLVARFDADVKKGDILHVPTLTNLAANNKVADNEVTLNAPTESEVDISINKHKEVSFVIEDIAEIQSNQDLMARYTEKAGYAIAKAIDDDLMALYSGLSQSVGTGGADLDEDDILSAKEYLDSADASREGRSLVIAPSQENVFLKIDRFTRQDTMGPNDYIKNGQIGKIHGFDVYATNNVVVASGTTYNLAFQRDAFALAMQMQPRVQAQYQQEKLGWLVTVDVIYGVAELRDTFGVKVLS